MRTVKGIYDGDKVQLLEKVPVEKPCKVIVTFEQEENVKGNKISELRGKITKSTNEQIDEQSQKLRNEWQRDI